MAYPHIKNTDIVFPTTLYGKAESFQHLFKLNDNSLYNYIESGNWTVPNQNIIVQFLNGLLVDINEDDEYIYNTISSKVNKVASGLKFTSIYNKGISFTKAVFPEKDHYTLITVPFGEPKYSCKYYFTINERQLKPITTLYTTDTTLRHSITKMSESYVSSSFNSNYSVILIDPFALMIGFVRYCRERIKQEHFVGVNTNSYFASYVLASFYRQHNQYVITNLFDHDTIEIDKPKWSIIDLREEIREYLDFQIVNLSTMSLKSFNQFIQQLTTMPLTQPLLDSVYPYTGSSRLFNRMEWIYSYGSMDFVYKYLKALYAQGGLDRQTRNQFRKFGRGNRTVLTQHITDPLFKKHFIDLHEEIKQILF